MHAHIVKAYVECKLYTAISIQAPFMCMHAQGINKGCLCNNFNLWLVFNNGFAMHFDQKSETSVTVCSYRGCLLQL